MGFVFICNQVLYSYSLSCAPFHRQLFLLRYPLFFFFLLKSDGKGRNSWVGKDFFYGFSFFKTVPLKIWVFGFFDFRSSHSFIILNPCSFVDMGFAFVEFGWFFFSRGFGIRTEEHGYPENLCFRSHKRVSVFSWRSW